MKKKLYIFFFLIFTLIILSKFISSELNKINEKKCFDNLRRLGQALNQYANDYDNIYPSQKIWENDLPKKYPEIYCPSAKRKLNEVKNVGFYGFAINNTFLNLDKSRVSFPKSTIIVFESAAGILSGGASQPFPNIDPDSLSLEKAWMRHHGGSNYLFADGHVRWHKIREVSPIDDYNGNDGAHPSFNLGFGIKQIREKSQ